MRVFSLSVLCIASFFSIECRAQNVDVNAYGVADDNSRRTKNTFTLEIRETIRETNLPLLPFIFFDEQSADIPTRYHTLNKSAALNAIENVLIQSTDASNELETYYELLNVIGSRLRARPTDTVALIGCKSVEESSVLPLRRANAIKQYFVNIFDISEQRIHIYSTSSGLPKTPTVLPLTPGLANEENRRVEIVGEWSIVGPILLLDKDTTTTPPNLEFIVFTEGIVKKVGTLTVKADDSVLSVQKSKINQERDTLKLRVSSNPFAKRRLMDAKNIVYSYTVVKSDNTNKKTGDKRIVVKSYPTSKRDIKVVEGIRVDEFNLILYDFKSAAITPSHQRIIESIQADYHVKSSSRIIVSGLSDITGDPNNNVELAKKRATTAEVYLRKHLSDQGVSDVNIKSAGEGPTDRFKDNYRFPESRMYNRAVRIRVETGSSDDP